MRARSPLCSAGLALACALPFLAGCGDLDSRGVPDLDGSDAYDVERYDISGEYDWSRGRLVASAGITLTTEAGVTAVLLDSAVTEVKAVRAAGGGDLAFNVDAEAGTLTVDVSSLGAGGQGAQIAFLIDYEAESGEALRAIPPRAGDPAAARVVFTTSEPRDARRWMPCHDRPGDRALVSFDMTMDGGETLIANGALVVDQGGGAARRMKYETSYPLPTYLMAFAISDFEVEEAQGSGGGAPVAVWHRRGVVGDHAATAAELGRVIAMFEGLLGSYPFERYAVVMLPDFSGGMENAGITFQSEVSTSPPSLSAALIAHELGHQWYGDAVTVATWDDLWIKEGMAVLLEGEAARPFEDRSGTGVLFGDRLGVTSGAAVRDVSLPPEGKYTSGPYDRGAWIWTQLRHEVGEGVFWATMRGLVNDHLWGTLSTEEVLAAFEPHLSPEAAAAAALAVDAKDLPELDVEAGTAGGVRVRLRDPDGILIAPLEVEWRREGGAVERWALAQGEWHELARAAEGDLLVMDPDDVHPDLSAWLISDDARALYATVLLPLTAPAAPSGVAAFLELPGIHQYSALYDEIHGRGEPPFSPGEYAAFVEGLDGDSARATTLAAVCSSVQPEEDPAVFLAWLEVLKDAATAEPAWRGLPYAPRPGPCGVWLSADALFAPELAKLSAGLATPALTVEEVAYLASFDLPSSEEMLAVWAPAAKEGYSMRVRSIAARQVVRAAGTSSDPLAAHPAAWRRTILELLAGSDASEVLRQVTSAGVSFRDAPEDDRAAFGEQMSRIVRLPWARLAHAPAVCGAYLALDPSEWTELAASIADAPMSGSARRVLEEPEVCL